MFCELWTLHVYGGHSCDGLVLVHYATSLRSPVLARLDARHEDTLSVIQCPVKHAKTLSPKLNHDISLLAS